jgi:hypothetical protein
MKIRAKANEHTLWVILGNEDKPSLKGIIINK